MKNQFIQFWQLRYFGLAIFLSVAGIIHFLLDGQDRGLWFSIIVIIAYVILSPVTAGKTSLKDN